MVQARVGADGTVGMMVRMPEALRDRIKAAADANGRSQNSEIVAALEEKYPAPQVDYAEILEGVMMFIKNDLLKNRRIKGRDVGEVFDDLRAILARTPEDQKQETARIMALNLIVPVEKTLGEIASQLPPTPSDD